HVLAKHDYHELEGDAEMSWRRCSLRDARRTIRAAAGADQTGDRPRSRGRLRPAVEGLEGRQLLAAVADFPLSSNQSAAAALTAGPDGNLWFPITAGVGQIGRITTAGIVTNFVLPGGYSSPSALTNGPDGNLYFTNLLTADNPTVPALGQITPG